MFDRCRKLEISQALVRCLRLAAFIVVPLGVAPAMAGSERRAAAMPVGEQITAYALTLIGDPYRPRGVRPETGFDCSGLVQHVFERTQGIELPRTARDMARVGRRVARGDLKPGDLVFYSTQGRTFSHVGIYIGGGRFVHAPSSGGRVCIVDMENTYWRHHYSGGRRVLENAKMTAASHPKI